MTKKLEELLDLPETKEIIDDTQREVSEQVKRKPGRPRKTQVEEIVNTIPSTKGLDRMAERELNEVADKAMQAYDDLMDLGMNVESRFSARIFEVANSMIKTSLDAKVAKLEKKLKLADLQLRKEKLDQGTKNDKNVVNSEGYVVTDRNSLLEQLKNNSKDK